MLHALIKRTIRVGAEAESTATNLVRFCAVHTENGVNSGKDRTGSPQAGSGEDRP